jgi:uncharacterized protein YqgC (DUF456 family)
MDDILVIALKSLVSLLTLGGLFLIPLGLPGTWFLGILGLICTLTLEVPWSVFWILVAGAIVGEVIDLFTSVGMAKKAGAGKPGMWGAFLGGLAGGILGTPIMPLIGTLIGAAVGAFAGAFFFEIGLAGKGSRESLKAGKGAFFGVLVARILKLMVGFAQAAWLILSIWGFMNGAGPAD